MPYEVGCTRNWAVLRVYLPSSARIRVHEGKKRTLLVFYVSEIIRFRFTYYSLSVISRMNGWGNRGGGGSVSFV